MATITATTTTAIFASILSITLLHLLPTSDASLFSQSPKVVIVTNNHSNYLSIRCYSFDSSLKIKHMKPSESFSFKVTPKAFFPSATMYNCSTNMGVFIAYKFDYKCAADTWNRCLWRFDLNQTYHYHPKEKKWFSFDYNPNYESLYRGGVVPGRYIN